MNNIEIARRLEYVARLLSKPGRHLQDPMGKADSFVGGVYAMCLYTAIRSGPARDGTPFADGWREVYKVVDSYWKQKGYISAICANDGQYELWHTVQKPAATHAQIVASLKTCARRLRKQAASTINFGDEPLNRDGE